MKRSSSFFLSFSLLFLSACTTSSMQMPPYRELQMQLHEQQSFLLGDHDITVRYLEAEPVHLVEITLDGKTKVVNIEQQQVCPPAKEVTKKIIDDKGNYVGTEKVIEQEPCWYAWQEGEVNFFTFLDSPHATLKLSVSLALSQGLWTL